jgi:ATP-dependent DNA helicase RecG
MARVFHDLELMEREGSGYDLLYEVLTSQGRRLPEVREGTDRVEVVVHRRVIKPVVIDFLAKADAAYQFTQRERIALGILVQHEALTVRQLAGLLELQEATSVNRWIGRLLEWDMVQQVGRTQGTRYFVNPDLLDRMDFPGRTTLARIESHRLRALILEDLERHPGSSTSKIRERIGDEIPVYDIRRQLKVLREQGEVLFEGQKRGRRYWPA